jgi:hypothetical protein
MRLRVPLACPPCIRNGPVERPVIPAWKQQRNTGDLRRNASAWLARPGPSDIAKSWRRWRRPGRGSPRRPTGKALTPRPDRIFPPRLGGPPGLPDEAIPAPGGPRFRVMERARHFQALGGVASILVRSPHRAPWADLAQRGERARRSGGANRAFTRFSRVLSRRAGRQPVCWLPKCSRDTGGGAPLGDRMSNPARVASRRGSSCAFAEYVDFAKSRVNSPRPTFFPARHPGAPLGGATAWP